MEVKTKTVKVLIKVDIHYTSPEALEDAHDYISTTTMPYLCYYSPIMNGNWFKQWSAHEFAIIPRKGYKIHEHGTSI